MDTCPSSETTTVRLHIKNMTITLKKNMLSEVNPIRVFDFLSPFGKESDNIKMKEAQAFIFLLHFLQNPA